MEDSKKFTNTTKVIIKDNKPDAIQKESNEEKQKKKFVIIDDYLNKGVKSDKRVDQKIVNSVKIHQLFDTVKSSLGESDKIKIEALFDKHFLFFKKSDLNSHNYPCLINFYKPNIEEALKTYTDNRLHLLYYIFRLVESIPTIEDKLFEYYKKKIKNKDYGLTSQMKGSITKDIIYSNEFNDFVNKYASWHSSSEIIIFQFYLTETVFKSRFSFNSSMFSLQSNFKWSSMDFASRNAAKISSMILRNFDIAVKLFGPTNFAAISMLLISNFYGGFSMRKIFRETKYFQFAIFGTFALNWIVSSITKYLDHYSSTCEYYKMASIVKDLNTKLEKISEASTELMKLCLISELNCFLQIEYSEISKSYVDEKIHNDLLLQKKIDELKLLIEKHISKVEDVNEEDLKQVEIEAMKWVEKTVSLSVLEEEEENGQSQIEDIKKKQNEKDWVLINIVRSYNNLSELKELEDK